MRLAGHNAIDIEYALREKEQTPPFPPASDRTYWSGVRAELADEEAAALITAAEADAREPVPTLPASRYLEFARTGRREGYQDPMHRRRTMLANLTVGELLEGSGRFLDPLLDVAWAICEEGSWAMPAHQSALADPDHPIVDLGAAMTALSLAEVMSLFGDQLDPALSKLVRHEVDRRCVTPYLTRHDHWWLYNTTRRKVNNWTAVCNAGVAGAAIHLERDPARLAEIIAKAARSMDDYLDTFTADGGSSEGPGYWSYGFGYYTLLAHLVEHRTGGKVDFLAGDRLRTIARYPTRTQLSPHRYVAFSDCDLDVRFIRSQLAYLAQRFDLPDLMALANDQDREGRAEPTWAIRELVWRPTATGPFQPSADDWFADMMWLLARAEPADPDALVVAVKGGHNEEMHNQNDVGSVLVHVGGESVIADLGRGRYTKAYFGPQRYEHFVNSSLGHSVPVPNGCEQLPGKEHAAQFLEHRADGSVSLLRMDLAGAYPNAADLTALVRTVALHRGDAPRVELTDEVRFGAAGTFESALITLGTATVVAGVVELRGERAALRVGYDADRVTVRVDNHTVDFPDGEREVQRVVFTLNDTAAEGSIQLRIEPSTT